MTVCLEQHGWKGCKVPISLEHVEEHLPTWKDVVILRPPETYGSRVLQFPFDALANNRLPAFQMGDQLDEGTYGKILKAQRAVYEMESPDTPTQLRRIEGFSEIVCKWNEIDHVETDEKWYEEEVQAILHEASLHALAYHTLASHNFPHAIPQLYEIYANARGNQRHLERASDIQSIVIGMEFVQGETLHTYFSKQFLPASRAREFQANDRLLMDILIQLCIYLEILQTDLRFNHRDLKINNVLRRTHPTPWSRVHMHPLLSRPWIAMHDLVIIDFGFACVACGESRKSLVQAGSWFKPSHDCLKRGRDLALFLHCLQSFYPLETRISPLLFSRLEKAMQVEGLSSGPTETPVSLLTRSVDRHGTPRPPGPIDFGDGIYKLLRKDGVDVPGCAPRALLATLNELRL